MHTLQLKKGKDQSLLRRHPWVFSGALHEKSLAAATALANGELVYVSDYRGQRLGYGFWQPGSIAVRMLAFGANEYTESIWKTRLTAAWQLRRKLGLTHNPQTTAYRLVFGEGDEVPGLVVDVYGSVAVLQAHHVGVWRKRELIVAELLAASEGRIQAIYDKSAETLAASAEPDVKNGYLYGAEEVPEAGLTVAENGIQFKVDWVNGQKTGFFLDQRENRALLEQLSKDKKVLNTFCYTGGFSVYALRGGAQLVHSVDVSARAVALTDENVALNGFTDRHKSYTADTFTFLKNLPTQYDVIVLDPPAFAKGLSKRHNAIMGYKRLNLAAMQALPPGGLLMTYSCSGVVTRDLFSGAIMAAAVEAGRSVRVLHTLSQPADHPYSLYHPEGAYLKGLVLQIN